jgi:hypothetical protein
MAGKEMKIREFIQATFRERADKSGALVVYDPAKRYHSLVLAMMDERCTVLDATASFIQAHEAAVERWAAVGTANADHSLIVYVPISPPTTSEDRCHDPFSSIAAGADWFPRSDDDSFQSLCERAKPDHLEKIRELFAITTPDLSTIDAVGGGNHWPQLQTLLGVESAADIIVALLIPSPEQEQKLRSGDGWLVEARELFGSQLGFAPKTKAKKWEPIVEEFWRFVLFSEFAFDLPGGLPESLAAIPRAKSGAEPLINRVCDTLRQEKHHVTYIERADCAGKELGLEQRMHDVPDLGKRDTFAFEERSFLRQYVEALKAGKWGDAAEIAAERKESVWVRHTDRGMLWTVAERAREVLVAASDLERDLPAFSKSVNELISFYTGRAYRLDQAHREMEKALADTCGESDGVDELVESARKRFLTFAEDLQRRFIDCVSKEGWPPGGRLRATQVFDQRISPLLDTRGKRIALFFVDALRYELGVALERQLAGSYSCRLHPVCAQLPTITAVGMAALLPKAEGNLFLKKSEDKLLPTLSRKPIRTPADRFAYTQEFYGDRVAMLHLDALLALKPAGKKKPEPLAGIDLLLVRTTEIDEQGEMDAANVCLFLPHVLAKLIASVGKLKKLGFHHVVFATDHGFVLHPGFAAGDIVRKPPGDWIQVKDRCMLGRGSATPETVLFEKEQVGIQGEIESYLVPRSLGTFNKRHPYFHEGLSLYEAMIPLIEIDLGIQEEELRAVLDVQLRYRGESQGTVTTRRPVLDVSVFGGELFSSEVSFRLEARAKVGDKETVVGEAASCEHVDPATGVVKLKAGQAVKVPLRIVEDFVGGMEVRAIDAETALTYGLPLKLKVEILT